jgi:hypothetical protein
MCCTDLVLVAKFRLRVLFDKEQKQPLQITVVEDLWLVGRVPDAGSIQSFQHAILATDSKLSCMKDRIPLKLLKVRAALQFLRDKEKVRQIKLLLRLKEMNNILKVEKALTLEKEVESLHTISKVLLTSWRDQIA